MVIAYCAVMGEPMAIFDARTPVIALGSLGFPLCGITRTRNSGPQWRSQKSYQSCSCVLFLYQCWGPRCAAMCPGWSDMPCTRAAAATSSPSPAASPRAGLQNRVRSGCVDSAGYR